MLGTTKPYGIWRIGRALAAIAAFGLVAACASTASDSASLETIAQELGLRDISASSLESLEDEGRQLYEMTLATCMKAQGFEYLPDATKAVNAEALGGRSVEDYIDEHGWSITDSIYRQSASDPTDRSSRDQYLASLSVNERDAYDVALDGGATDGGCSTFASDHVRGEIPAYATVTEYSEQLTSVIEQFNSDFRILAFHRAWSSCMIERGFSYASPEAMRSDLTRRALNLFSPSVELSDFLVEETRSFERDAARASHTCGLPPAAAGQPDVYEEVLQSLASRFLQENPDFGQK